jgi:iron complex outermembrane receptor protein
MNIASENGVLAIRLAGNIAHRDGYTTSVVTGQKLDERDYKAFRFSALLKPFEGFENLTIIDGRGKDQNGTSALLRQINPASPLAPALAPLLARQQALGVRKTLIASPIFDRQYSFGITNKTSWEISDDITLKNIVSFRRTRTSRASDYDGTAIQTFFIENAQLPREWSFGQDGWTEEFQVQGKLPSIGLNYILGYYHEQSKPGFPQEIRQSQFGSVGVRHLDNDDKSDALFAHVEAELTDRLQLSGGFRYTWDKREGSVSVFNTAGTCTQRVPPGTGPLVCPFTASAKFDAPSYDATLQYKLADRALVYAAYRHGYKSGALNLPSPDDQFTVVQPETVDEYEMGLKADWDIGVPLRTNISAFLDKYDDIQISQPVLVPGVGVIALVRNAAKATNKGIEFEGTIMPADGLSLGGFVSWLDAHSDVTVPGTSAVKGRQTAFQPKWKYGVNARFDVPVAESFGKLSLSADYSWQSKVNTNETNPALITTYPSYGVLNARIELGDIAGSGVDLALFGTT